MSDNYRQNIDDIDRLHVLSDDPSLYVQNACVTDPELAPRGMSTLYVLAPVTHQHENVDWASQSAGFREKVLDQLVKFGIKDIRNRIRFEKLVTPAHWERDYELHRGATFSLAHNLGQMLHMRPGNRFKDVDGVYLTGGGTHPGSGLPVIFESARVSTGLLLEDLGVHAPSVCAQPASGHQVTRPVMVEAR
jgi:phytoene desaturase